MNIRRVFQSVSSVQETGGTKCPFLPNTDLTSRHPAASRDLRLDRAGAPALAIGGGYARPPRRWRAFALLAVAFFMTIVDLTIVNVALPTIGRKLHFPEADLQWVVTAYGLTFGGFLLLGGRAADLLGRRRLLMAGLARVHRRLARLRPGAQRRLHDRHAGRPGPRGGAHAARSPVHRHEHVRRGCRAQQGARDLGRHRRRRGHGRPASWRRAHPLRSAGSTSST